MFSQNRSKTTSYSFGYGEFRATDVTRLLALFEAGSFIIEIYNIGHASEYVGSLENSKLEYLVSSKSSKDAFVDVLVAKRGYDDLPELLEEIVQSDPEALYIYLTDMPIEQLDYCKQNLSSSELISIMDADCTIEVLLYENALLVSYKTELYDSSMVKQHIEEILLG